jgi:mono/diheme cytochrome c family protein
MLTNKFLAEFQGKSKVKFIIFAFCLLSFTFATACRYDMQDQPRYKVYKSSDWFKDGRASRELPDGTVPRGYLRENKALYTGKIEGATATAQTNEQGQQITFPDAVTEFPMPVTAEVLDTGEKKFKVYCSLCHGNFGNGDGIIVRRGFPKPPSYNDDRLRNAPVGHFFDVSTNGWGKMSGYASQVSVADRWAIVAYIRALQISQNPNKTATTTTAPTGKTEEKPVATPAPTSAGNANVATKPSNTNTSSNVKTTTTVKPANTGGHQ